MRNPFRLKRRRLRFCNKGAFGNAEPSPWMRTNAELLAWRDAQDQHYPIRECVYIPWESWAHGPHWEVETR